MTTVVRKVAAPFEQFGVGFNHQAANAVYGAIMKCATDDEAAVLSSMLLGEMLKVELVLHGGEITEVLAKRALDRQVEIGKRLVNRAVEMTREGLDPSATLRAIETLDVLAKAASFDPEMFDERPHSAVRHPMTAAQESMLRAMQARQQKRDLLTGQFIQEHRPVMHAPGEKALHDKDAKLIGIPAPPSNLSSKQRAIYQRGYREIQGLLSQFHGLGEDDAVVHVNYTYGDPDIISPKKDGGKLTVPLKNKTHPGDVTGQATEGLDPYRKVDSVSLSVLPSRDFAGPGVQARFGNALSEGGLLNQNGTWDAHKEGSLAHELTHSTDVEQYTPGARALRRLGSLSGSLNQSLGDNAPARLKLALTVGEHAGKLGPQAQTVIGPAADRAAYRYRGTERKVLDPGLQNSLVTPPMPGPERRHFLIHGTPARDERDSWHPSPLINYWRHKLPRADLNTLQRKSGAIPPSQGVIIDKSGRPVVQAVGYADDHYLPFNLKNLSKLKGGEYIRTRTFGGPTTEDIYTGLISGAKGLTVVSHAGSYTLDFDDDLKGGRRFNDKAARMVARYGQLLDAVKSEQVRTAGIHPSKLAEIERAASSIYSPDENPDEYQGEFDRLKRAELRRPTFTDQQRQEAAVEWLEGVAGERRTADGHAMNAADLTHDIATNRARATMLRHASEFGGASGTLGEYRDREMAALHDDDPVAAARKVATALGGSNVKALDSHIARAEDEYRASLRPLALDAQGYDLALKALQEQFPYYIKDVQFHPWEDGKPGANARDTGYVAPRHNRPAKVLAGYFDAKVLGHGKVTADSTRFQNFNVHQGKLNLVERKKDEGHAGGTSGASGVKDVSGDLDPQTAKVLKREAAKNLITELAGHDTFSPHAAVPGAAAGAAGIANEDIRALAADVKMKGIFPNIQAFYSKQATDHLADMAEDPAKVNRMLQGVMTEIEKGKLLDLNPKVRRSFLNDGRPDTIKPIGARATDHLDDPTGTEYDIPNQMLSPDMKHQTTTQLDALYSSDPTIGAVRSDLPDSPADGNQFRLAASAVRSKLQSQTVELAQWMRAKASNRAVGPPPADQHVLDRQAKGLLHAEQLQRRYAEAQSRETLITPSQAPDQVTHVVHHEGEFNEGHANRVGGTRIVEGQ